MASLASKILSNTRIQRGITSKILYRPTQGCLGSKVGRQGRRWATTLGGAERVMGESPVIIRSPHRDINIPDNISLGQYMLSAFPKYGDNVAIVDGITGEETTYNQLTTRITRVASAFVKAGLRKGDVLTIFSPNNPEFAITYLAAASVGAIVSAVNPVYTAGELQHAVSHSEAKFLITTPALTPIAKEAAKQCPQLKDIIVFGESQGCRPFKTMLEDDGTEFPENLDFNPKEDLVALPYSSGTTGLPKGVMLSQYNVVSNIEQIRTEEVLHYGPDGSLVGVLPFFHIYGLVVVLLSALKQGSKITSLPRFEPQLFLETISNQRTTFLHVVPPIVLFLAQHPLVDKYDLTSLHTFFTGAAPVGANVIEQVVERFAGKISFRQGYGLTESSPVTHCNPPVGFNLSSIGPPVHNTESKIVDVTSGKTLGYGHEGEVWLRGPQVMKGYLKNPKATAETVDEDGWLHTGDVGYCQPDGHFFITDRIKELIKVKGLQVAPAELEALLLQHPSIQDTAVIGVEDERAGELPRAYVVLKPSTTATQEDIQDFVKEKVAPFKQLAGGVEFINEIPKSASGKILRRILKDAYKNK